MRLSNFQQFAVSERWMIPISVLYKVIKTGSRVLRNNLGALWNNTEKETNIGTKPGIDRASIGVRRIRQRDTHMKTKSTRRVLTERDIS